MIFSAYNRAEFDDPQLAVANMVTMLSQYPAPVMTEVCSPRTGIQTAVKWPPKLSELREWCERISAELVNREHRAQLAQHRVLLHGPAGLVPEEQWERETQEARDRAVAHWQQTVRPNLQTVERTADRKGEPPGLSDEDRRTFYQAKADEIRAGKKPLPMLSEAAKIAIGLVTVEPHLEAAE